MQILLVSTYELGRQPVHVSSPAASLRAAGHDVRPVDISVDTLEPGSLEDVDAVAISVPMHTAKRLADQLTSSIWAKRPDMPICHYGLYAGVGQGSNDLVTLQGEYEPGLLDWLDGLREGRSPSHDPLGKGEFRVPDRRGLPELGAYARLEHEGVATLVGAVEASHGCRHRCRHCPIPSVYDGRLRVVSKDVVGADIANLVGAGAGHVTFGDADFLNAPRHSLAVLEKAHQRFPDLTFDVTIKVEHLVTQRSAVAELAEMNVLFIVSAFESVDDTTLRILDKGHTVEDMSDAVELVRGHGITIRPTWLPFMPWTTVDDVVGIVEFIDGHLLWAETDPVQLAIKLLLPRGSLLEGHERVVPYLGHYDPVALSWQWRFEHHDTEMLSKELAGIAEEASDCGQETSKTLTEMRDAIGRAAGRSFSPLADLGSPAPRLTESWFCCAEPTGAQANSTLIQLR